ncbi:hypothetical protein BURMUCF2_1628 [Burkholderia multivorans CF2]|nr:hypothetical protein BURMUCF2_1628 [Burkholderia multivorans CF2]
MAPDGNPATLAVVSHHGKIVEGRRERDAQVWDVAIRSRRLSLSELLCARHKLMAKEPRYATQT